MCKLIKEFINQEFKKDSWFYASNKNRFYEYGHYELCNQAFELGLLERKIDDFYNEKGILKRRIIYFKMK